MKRTYDDIDSTRIKTSGLQYEKASIGVFVRDQSSYYKKGKATNFTAGVAKYSPISNTTTIVPQSKKKFGVKKSWAGPSYYSDSVSMKSAGFTEWVKETNGINGTLSKYTCQTLDTTKAFDTDEAQVYLWDKAGKTIDLWQMK